MFPVQKLDRPPNVGRLSTPLCYEATITNHHNGMTKERIGIYFKEMKAISKSMISTKEN
ncbi:hypothetical protein DPMN_031049 [Dreissena polymorpha]|uniref:Uncharacterized protein n=1 Tax=Dreissena polymorpha TaxID=45954 RepID=A0A9D4M2B2_DREPO|nr:hypothetical protein DPMN_031049 [Dreissena polymorpha]